MQPKTILDFLVKISADLQLISLDCELLSQCAASSAKTLGRPGADRRIQDLVALVDVSVTECQHALDSYVAPYLQISKDPS